MNGNGMSDNWQRIERVILSALGAAIPTIIAVWHLKEWLVNHPDFQSVIRDICTAVIGGG